MASEPSRPHADERSTRTATGQTRVPLIPRGDDGADVDHEDRAHGLGAVMPAFTWVLRDFALELADERGDAITADEYLDRSLRPQRGFEAAVLERNRVRHVLGAFFPKRQCRTLVRPVHDEAKLQQVDSLSRGTETGVSQKPRGAQRRALRAGARP